MSIFDNIKKSTAEIKEQIESQDKASYSGNLVEEIETFYGQKGMPKLKSSEYLRAAIGWVYGCVTVIADEVATIDLKMMKYVKGEQTEVDDHTAIDVLYKANNAMTRFDLINTTFQYLELTGEAPWYISFKNGQPDSIILLRPDRLIVKPGKNGEVIGGYKYKVYLDSGYKEIDLEPFEVVPLRYIDPDNPVRGKGPLQAASVTYDLDNYAEKWNSQFFKNSASPSAALSTDKVLAKDVRTRLQKKLDENYRSVDNAHKTMILENGLKWQSISVSQKDMDFIEQQKFSRDKILSIFRVPPTALGLTADVTRANAEATDYVFAKRTIRPKMVRFVEQLNEFFLPLFKGTDSLYFDFKDPVPQNTELLIKQADSGVNNGYMTVNEARESLGLDPIDGGDVLRDPSSPSDPLMNPDGTPIKAIRNKALKASRYQKHLNNARIRGLTEKNKLAKATREVVQKSVTEIVYSLLKKKSKKDSVINSLPWNTGTKEEQQESKYGYQEKQLNVADKYESRFIKKLDSVFAIQKNTINRSLDSGDKAKLDVTIETERYTKVLKPVMIELMREQARLAFQILGVQRGFDSQEEKDLSFLQRLSQYFEARVFKFATEITKVTNEKLASALKEGTAQGESIAQLKKRISTLFDDMAGYRSERIARTETIRGSNFATEEAYKESGVVEAKEWLTTRDERTDDECASLDGKVIPLGKDFQSKKDNGYENVEFPPIHVNCRCTLIPVISRS